MSSYSFIPDKSEYKEIVSSLNKLDSCKNNNEIAEASRCVLDNAINLIYDYRNEYKPTEATMLELIDSKTVARFINRREIIESMHYVRKLGMNALHDYKIKKTQAELSKNNIEFVLKYIITKIENPENLDKLILPKYMSEAKTRKIYIDLYLKEAGWEVIEPTESVTLPSGQNIKAGSILPKKACSEIKVEGMKNASGIGFCDYVLYSKDGKPLAIVEAKKTSEDITKGIQQVKEYGRCMKDKYGYVPVLYYTNGYEIHIIDGLYVDRQVMGFHSIDELEYMIQRRNRKPMTNIVIDDSIAGRPYQKQAVTKVCERFNEKYLRSLLVMATGTGKTRVSMSIVKVLLDNNWIKNVLFLADRTSLVEQAFKSFNKILSNMSYQVLSNPKLANEPNARIVFSTHQTMINYIDAEEKKYTCGRFDLIIIDDERVIIGTS